MEWLILLGALGVFFLFVRFTIVKEGTAKAVMTLGKFSRVIFQWENHWMDVEWNIWREGEKESPNRAENEKKIRGRIFGGLYFYIWPLYGIHKYPLRWTDLRRVEETEEKIEKPQFHDEELKYVMLKPAVYWTKLFKVETLPPERIPVNIEILVTMRISNPFRFLFVAPPTPLEDVLARIDALMRAIVGMLKIDEIIYLKGKSGTLWEGEEGIGGLKDEKLIQETLPKWGLQIAEQGIDIKNIGLSPEYQKAAAAQKRLEFEAAARSAETVGTVIEMMARARGKKVEDIQKEIEAQPELQKEFLDLAKDLVVRKLGIEGRSYVDIRVQGAEGIERTILNALAAWQRMPIDEGKEKNKEEKTEEVKADEIKKPLSPEAERIMKRTGEALKKRKRKRRS